MKHESPVMKAWREFAMADPKNCDQEWDVYLVLVNWKGSKSSSPTNPATAATAPSASSSTAASVRVATSTRVPTVASLNSQPASVPSSSATTSPTTPATAAPEKDDLSPGARLIYDIITSETREIYEAKMASYLARPSVAGTAVSSPTASAAVTDEIPVGDSAPQASSASLHAPSSVDPAAATSTSTASSVLDASRVHIVVFPTKDDLYPESRGIYKILVGDSAPSASTASLDVPSRVVSTIPRDPTVLNFAPVAVDIKATDLATSVPTSCSSECPSHEVDVPLSVFISSAEAMSPTTIGGIPFEFSAPVVSVEALHEDAMVDIVVSIYSLVGPACSIGKEYSMATSLTPRSVPPSFNAPSKGMPSPLSVRLSELELCTLSLSTNLTYCSGDMLTAVASALSSNFTVQSSSMKQQLHVLRPLPWSSLIVDIHVRTLASTCHNSTNRVLPTLQFPVTSRLILKNPWTV